MTEITYCKIHGKNQVSVGNNNECEQCLISAKVNLYLEMLYKSW
jgi:hypothetical protein